MMYEDKNGTWMMPEEVEELSACEIEERGIHIIENPDFWLQDLNCLKR